MLLDCKQGQTDGQNHALQQSVLTKVRAEGAHAFSVGLQRHRSNCRRSVQEPIGYRGPYVMHTASVNKMPSRRWYSWPPDMRAEHFGFQLAALRCISRHAQSSFDSVS